MVVYGWKSIETSFGLGEKQTRLDAVGDRVEERFGATALRRGRNRQNDGSRR